MQSLLYHLSEIFAYTKQHLTRSNVVRFHTYLYGCVGAKIFVMYVLTSGLSFSSLSSRTAEIYEMTTGNPTMKIQSITNDPTTAPAFVPGHYYIKYRNNALIPKRLFQDFDKTLQSQANYLAQLTPAVVMQTQSVDAMNTPDTETEPTENGNI